MDNVIPLPGKRTSERLESLARKPFSPNRETLRELAERCRRIEALQDRLHEDEAGHHDHHGQLELGEAA